MDTQKRFRIFNDEILMDYDSNKELAEKRDILLDILKNDDNLPTFDILNQGSYAMHTGIKPDNNHDVDLDVALIFNVNKKDYNVLTLKKEIYNKLKNHTYYGATIKKPCVTVTYSKHGEPSFHLDLVTYVYENKNNKESQLYIAKGIENNQESIKWEKSDPKGLVNYINNYIKDSEEREQCRRVIRYLKYWKHLRFSNAGHIEPPSIGLTLLCINSFKYFKDNDLEALQNCTDYILNQFTTYNYENEVYHKIELNLPINLRFERCNVFQKMTVLNMNSFWEKINKLNNDLLKAISEVDEYKQQCLINRIFDNYFDLKEEDTFKKQTNYIPRSSSSGKINEY